MARVMLGAAYRIVWSDVDGIDNLDVLIGASPQGVMYHFVEGVMCYHAVKEDKKTAICLFICTLLIIFIITGKIVLIWDVIGMLLLVAIKYHKPCREHPVAEWIIAKLASCTYTVYLFHEVAMEVVAKCVVDTSGCNTLVYVFLSVALIAFFCIVVDWMMKMISK